MNVLSLQTAALGLAAATSLVVAAPAQAQSRFNDVQSGDWAAAYIQALADRGIVSGFPDGSFRPEAPVTRAQYAAMVDQAFSLAPSRNAPSFGDVSGNNWAAGAIASAYRTGFMSGYPGNEFRPGENIPRVQVLVSLANGLGYSPINPLGDSLGRYRDASAIPDYATASIAAATDQNLVVNYPDVSLLSPNRRASRAEVAAFIYQALANQNQVAALDSPYLVRSRQEPIAAAPLTIPAGQRILMQYNTAEKIYLAPNEPNPLPLTLTTRQNLQTEAGQVLIPAGSEILGQLQSNDSGAQFFAQQLRLPSGESYDLAARSEVITRTEVIREGASAGRIVRDAAIGAGAAAIISGVTGDRTIGAGEVLGGAGAGAIFGAVAGRKSAELFVIDPDKDLSLTLDQPLRMQ